MSSAPPSLASGPSAHRRKMNASRTLRSPATSRLRARTCITSGTPTGSCCCCLSCPLRKGTLGLTLFVFSPPVNERWLYNCVQNLLTVHLKPELLDSPVPRLRDMVNQSGAAGDGSANSNGLLGDNNTGRKRGELHPHSEKEDGNNSSESFIVNSSSSTLLGREPSSRGPSANSDEEHGYHDDEDDDNSESSVVTSNHGDNLPFDDLDPSNFAVPITTTIKIRPTAATGTHAATSAHAATGAYAATGHAAAAAHAATKHATAAAHAAAAAAAARKEPKTPWTEDDIELMIRLKDFDGLTHEEVAVRTTTPLISASVFVLSLFSLFSVSLSCIL